MQEHKGKIVEEAIKKSGYQIKALAERLGIARNTLYARLRGGVLDDAFIEKVGKVIHYDFSIDFPEMVRHRENANRVEDGAGTYHLASSRNPDVAAYGTLDKKYLKLLEDYNKLLKLLILLANNNELAGIKQEISDFLDKESNED